MWNLLFERKKEKKEGKKIMYQPTQSYSGFTCVLMAQNVKGYTSWMAMAEKFIVIGAHCGSNVAALLSVIDVLRCASDVVSRMPS